MQLTSYNAMTYRCLQGLARLNSNADLGLCAQPSALWQRRHNIVIFSAFIRVLTGVTDAWNRPSVTTGLMEYRAGQLE